MGAICELNAIITQISKFKNALLCLGIRGCINNMTNPILEEAVTKEGFYLIIIYALADAVLTKS